MIKYSITTSYIFCRLFLMKRRKNNVFFGIPLKQLIVLILYFVSFGLQSVFSQQQFPVNYFSSPLDIPLELAGNFGELRTNHLHSGLDLKTNEMEGFNVYAIADAYVSRIKVSSTGYGNALYLTHPNGYVSVYGHLKQFNLKITKYLRKKQYQKESFEIDLSLHPNEIRIKKGDTIALSGNSGSSDGPHLHFEIREAKKEIPINPQLFGFEIKDSIPPVIDKILCVNERSKNYNIFNVNNIDNRFFISQKDTLLFPSEFSLGISCYDKSERSFSKNGIYKLALYFDSILIQKLIFNKFSFDETRYVNALINYKLFVETNKKFIQSKLLPGNKLNIFDTIYNNGIINISDDNTHQIKYKTEDFAGNFSELNFAVKKDINEIFNTDTNLVDSTYFIDCLNSNMFSSEKIKLFFTQNSLYENIFLKIKSYKSNDAQKFFSDIFEIHDANVPINKSITMLLKNDSIVDSLLSKLLIIRIKNDNKIVSVGGKFKDGFVMTNINNFGNFAVSIDTIAPVIKALNYSQKTLDKRQKSLDFKITDELSGIANYRATLNGKWVLMEFDSKNNRLTYVIDNQLCVGSNQLKITVEDNKKNSSELNLLINK